VTRAVISHSIFIFQSPLVKGSPTILEVCKQYQTSSSPKKRVQVQGHGAAQKSESSDSSSGMFVLTQCVMMSSVRSVSTYPIPSAVCRSKEHILSDNKVLGLMPLQGCGIAHKPVVAGFCSHYGYRGLA